MARGELPAAWLTVEQNERLAAHHHADRADRAGASDAEAVVDSRARCRMSEIFAAMLPIEWG